ASAPPPSVLRGGLRLASGRPARLDRGVAAPHQSADLPRDARRGSRRRRRRGAGPVRREPQERVSSDQRLGRGLPRPVEAALALAGVVVAAPVIGLAALATVATSGLPVFFRQTRIGRGGKPFTLVKLRSMRPAASGPQVTSRGDPRITPVGALLRRTKLDELPELWNILRGDMSFVRPPPEV